MMSMFWYTASAVPRYQRVLRHALARRQDVEAFVALGAKEIPAALQMADQAVRLVLRRHRHAADAGIQRVRQREIDDAQLAAEIDRRLGAPVGQFHQPAAAAARQDDRPWPVGPRAHRWSGRVNRRLLRGDARDFNQRALLRCSGNAFSRCSTNARPRSCRSGSPQHHDGTAFRACHAGSC